MHGWTGISQGNLDRHVVGQHEYFRSEHVHDAMEATALKYLKCPSDYHCVLAQTFMTVHKALHVPRHVF
jgi:hypothetical protein